MLLAGPCARHDHGRRNSRHTGSCPGRGVWGTGSIHTGARHGGKVPAVQGEAPARINQEVPSWTRSLEKLPGRPGTPLHLSPMIRETVPRSLCSAHVGHKKGPRAVGPEVGHWVSASPAPHLLGRILGKPGPWDLGKALRRQFGQTPAGPPSCFRDAATRWRGPSLAPTPTTFHLCESEDSRCLTRVESCGI